MKSTASTEETFVHDAAAAESAPKLRAYMQRPDGVRTVPIEEAAALIHARTAIPAAQRRQSAPAPALADTPPVAENELAAAGPVPAAAEPIVWVDVVNPGEEEGRFLREQLGFHPLAVEDCLRGRQRPKLERYPSYFFLVMYAAYNNMARERVSFNELHIFVGRSYVVTVRDHGMREVRETIARWRAQPSALASSGALAHALLDMLVDDYFPIVDHFADRVGRIESELLEGDQQKLMTDTLTLRRELLLFRKVVSPERDMLSSLLRRDLPFLSPELLPYFQDVRDHIFRITEEIDTLRDLLSTTVEAQMSIASNQLNQVLRMMTAWSIILMSMTLIAGIYGMNFLVMPELEWRYGYAGALLLMLSIGLGLVTFFRRRDWI